MSSPPPSPSDPTPRAVPPTTPAAGRNGNDGGESSPALLLLTGAELQALLNEIRQGRARLRKTFIDDRSEAVVAPAKPGPGAAGGRKEPPTGGVISRGGRLDNGICAVLPVRAGETRPATARPNRGPPLIAPPQTPPQGGSPSPNGGSRAVKAAASPSADDDDRSSTISRAHRPRQGSSPGGPRPVPNKPKSLQTPAAAAGFAHGQLPSLPQPQQQVGQVPPPPPTGGGPGGGMPLESCRPLPPPSENEGAGRFSQLLLQWEAEAGVDKQPPLPRKLTGCNAVSPPPLNRQPLAITPMPTPPAVGVAVGGSGGSDVLLLPTKITATVDDSHVAASSANVSLLFATAGPNRGPSLMAPPQTPPPCGCPSPNGGSRAVKAAGSPSADDDDRSSTISRAHSPRQGSSPGGRRPVPNKPKPLQAPAAAAGFAHGQLPSLPQPQQQAGQAPPPPPTGGGPGGGMPLESCRPLPPPSENEGAGRFSQLLLQWEAEAGVDKQPPLPRKLTGCNAVSPPPLNRQPLAITPMPTPPAVGVAVGGSRGSDVLLLPTKITATVDDSHVAATSVNVPLLFGQEILRVDVGLVIVEALLGNIVDENTDAIVNSTDRFMNLTGYVSKALLEKGGSKIAADCNAKGQIGKTGVFSASTQGTSLQFKYILHADVLKPVEFLAKSCLKEADRLNLHSISLPALGTGNFQEQPENVIPRLVSGVREFLTSTTLSHLRLVRFVAFDLTTMDIFKKEITAAPGPHDGWIKEIGYREEILSPDSQEYNDVKNAFFMTASLKLTNIMIKRIENPTLLKQYALQKSKVAASMLNGSTLPVERFLWHGTDEESYQNICFHGFNRSYCGVNGVVYGQGVYFARDASYSTNYSKPNKAGVRHMIYSRVLTGEFIHGDEDMRVPPQKTHGNQAKYDTSVDSVENPSIFVIYHDSQAYPEFVIKFC